MNIWIQYTLIDGIPQATNSQAVDNNELVKIGRGQIEYNGEADPYSLTITKEPPIISG